MGWNAVNMKLSIFPLSTKWIIEYGVSGCGDVRSKILLLHEHPPAICNQREHYGIGLEELLAPEKLNSEPPPLTFNSRLLSKLT